MPGDPRAHPLRGDVPGDGRRARLRAALRQRPGPAAERPRPLHGTRLVVTGAVGSPRAPASVRASKEGPAGEAAALGGRLAESMLLSDATVISLLEADFPEGVPDDDPARGRRRPASWKPTCWRNWNGWKNSPRPRTRKTDDDDDADRDRD